MSDDETYSTIRTVFGSTERTSRWHLTDEVDVLTALGRAKFDLRLVETTGRPVAEISVKCFLGTVSLIVPPGTLVMLDGTSFLASASCKVASGDDSELPRIDVTATTILGRVRIVSSEPDEPEVEEEPEVEAAEPPTDDLADAGVADTGGDEPEAGLEPVEDDASAFVS